MFIKILLKKPKNFQKLVVYLPNILTASRLLLVFPLIFFLEIKRHYFVFILIIIGGLTDFFDGLIARKLNLKSKLGAILDPLSDKIFYLIPLVYLCVNNLIPFWSLSLILFREFIISCFRTTTKDGLPASMLGKFKTSFFFLSLIFFFLPLEINFTNDLGLFFYWLGFLLTFATFINYLRFKKNVV